MANAGFGKMMDWFGMESAALKLVASDSGVSDCGSEESGILRNPSCTYEVVANTTISATLGAAWAAASGVSGYMLTNVTIRTPFAAFPQVTFSAVANEGVAAINQFAFSVPILGRARPQNLLGAIIGGGDLQDFTLTASCDPVVLFEGLMPCASDVTQAEQQPRTRARPRRQQQTASPSRRSRSLAAASIIRHSHLTPRKESDNGLLHG